MKPHQIDHIKRSYLAGTRVRLFNMQGENDMPSGLEGTVQVVDDIGQIHVAWDNGRSLAIAPEVDSFMKITLEKELNQFLKTIKNEETYPVSFVEISGENDEYISGWIAGWVKDEHHLGELGESFAEKYPKTYDRYVDTSWYSCGKGNFSIESKKLADLLNQIDNPLENKEIKYVCNRDFDYFIDLPHYQDLNL